jgi:hypothetical protein
MKTDSHTITCVDGAHQVTLDIFSMDRVEAIDVYDLPSDLYYSGGYRVEGFVNGASCGTRFYSGLLGSGYYGDDSSDVAREFLAEARRLGLLPLVADLLGGGEHAHD